ncbi:MAG: hypothetical protein R6U93_08880 [Dehalococcoidia bacterium]
MKRKYWVLIIAVGVVVAVLASFGHFNPNVGEEGSVLGIPNALNLVKPPAALAQTESSTFPADEAGIAAYVELDSVDGLNMTVVGEAYHTIEASGESYIVGTVPVWKFPHVYLGLDGWMVAYMLKTEEASRIVRIGCTQTENLEYAIEYMCDEIGVTSSTPVEYYDFEFPEANKMTVIVEDLVTTHNHYYVTVPGTLYEASYQVHIGTACYGARSTVSLEVDGNQVASYALDWSGSKAYFDDFDTSSYFQAGITHLVASEAHCCSGESGFATVLIYAN